MCDYDIIFDIYISDDIKKLSNEKKLKHMPQLVSHFYNYLNSIEPDSIILPNTTNKVQFQNKFKIKIEKLEKYINIIIDFLQYSSTEVTLITNKKFLRIKYFDNYYLLLDLIIISIIIFYKYKASISILGKIKILKKLNIDDIYNDLKIDDEIKKKILNQYKFENDDKIKKKILNTFNFEYKIPNEYYKYRYIKLLNYLFFGYLKANFNNNIKYKELNDIIIFFQNLNVIKSTNIYTIPQYEGICWFTAFINSICYSDANKNLLLSLKDINIPDKNLNISRENDNYKTILIKLVYIIINDCKVCTIINIFKTIPILFLKSIHKDIINNRGIIDIKSKFFTELKKKNIDEKNYGLSYHEKDVFKDLYNFLNIRSIFLIFKKNKLYINNDEIYEIPHIILIYNAPNYDLNNLIKFDKINNYKNDIEIVYNNNTYVLDYIMYSSLHINKNIKEGHVISSITYNGKEYFHDTSQIINDEYGYYTACEFVRKNWKDDFKYKNNKIFSLNKCYYINTNTNKSGLSKQLLRYTIENEYQYSMLNTYVACYVKKIPEIPKAGGNNENLTSTNIKINVVINNKNIQRTVYINNNGIRFIKYNNKLIKIYYK